MSTSFFSTLDQHLKTFDSKKDSIKNRQVKLEKLENELALVNDNKWEEILERKNTQLEAIGKKYEQWTKSGLFRKNAVRNESQNKFLEVVSKSKKRIVCQKCEIEKIMELRARCGKMNDMSILNYRKDIMRRIEKCRVKIKKIQQDEFKYEFLTKAALLIHDQLEEEPNSLPWCGDPKNIRKAPYHLIGKNKRKELRTKRNQRKYLGKSEEEDTSEKTKLLQNLISRGNYVTNEKRYEKCSNCGMEDPEWSQDNQTQENVCKGCGYISFINFDQQSTKGLDYNLIKPYSYKRMNHFIDCLKQRQGKETTTISTMVISKVSKELLEKKMLDPREIRPKHIRDILGKIGESQSYEHEISIWCRITGNKPPRLSESQMGILQLMFEKTQKPYEKFKNGRNNYLTYTYVIGKMMEICGFSDEILEFYPSLRSKNRLECQEEIWEKICGELGWPFYKSKFSGK